MPEKKLITFILVKKILFKTNSGNNEGITDGSNLNFAIPIPPHFPFFPQDEEGRCQKCLTVKGRENTRTFRL